VRVVDLSFQGGYTEKTADKQQQTTPQTEKQETMKALKAVAVAKPVTKPNEFRGELLRKKRGDTTVFFQGLKSNTEVTEPFLRESLNQFDRTPERSCLKFKKLDEIPSDLAHILSEIRIEDSPKLESYLVIGQNGGKPAGVEVCFMSGRPYVFARQSVKGLRRAFVAGLVFLDSGNSKK